jgi:hypothetical protein
MMKYWMWINYQWFLECCPLMTRYVLPFVTILLADALLQVEKINRFDGDRAKLAKPEQFLIEVYHVPITYCCL